MQMTSNESRQAMMHRSPLTSLQLLDVRGIYLSLVILQSSSGDAFLKYIHLRLREVPSTDALLEEKIQLRKGPPRGLSDSEVGVDDAEEAMPASRLLSQPRVA